MNNYDDLVAPQIDDDKNNPYREVTDALATSRDRDLRMSAKAAQNISPDQAGKNADLSAKTGLPPSLVNSQYDTVKKESDHLSVDYSRISENPGFAKWMSTPNNFAIGQDDLQNAGMLEWLLNAPIKAFHQGQAQVEFGNARYGTIFKTPDAGGRVYLDSLRERMRAGGDLGVDSFGGGMITGTASFVPQMLHSLYSGAKYGAPAALGAGGAAMLGGPASPITVPAAAGIAYTAGSMAGMAEYGFKQEAGHAYEEYSKMVDIDGKPLNDDLAKVAALAAGGINAGLEAVQMKLILKAFPQFQNVATTPARAMVVEALQIPTVRNALMDLSKRYGEFITQEVGVEIAQRAVTIIAGELGKSLNDTTIKHRTASDVGADLVGEGVGAFQSFALMGVPGVAAHGVKQYGEIKEAKTKEQMFLEVGKLMAESKVWERSPGAAEDMVHSMTEGNGHDTVFISPQAFTEYFQSKKLDPKLVAREIMGDTVEYENALSTGHDMQIPIELYAARIAPTEHNAFFAQELKFDPNDMNAREATEHVDALKQQTEELHAKVDEESQTVQDVVAKQLEASGYERKTADMLSQQMAAFFSTQAKNQKMGILDLFKKYVLRIAGGDVDAQGGQVMNQPVYHGTPHEFDKFELNKIGSGEGAQAYGWGLYFASNRKVAEWYRDRLTEQQSGVYDSTRFMKDPKVKPELDKMVADLKTKADVIAEFINSGGQRLEKTDVFGKVAGTFKYGMNYHTSFLDDVRKELGTDLMMSANQQVTAADVKKTIDKIISAEPKKGRLYHVEIPEPEHFLDYDGSHGVQPPAVQKLMDEMENHAQAEARAAIHDLQVTAKALLHEVSKHAPRDTKGWSVMNDFHNIQVYDKDLNPVSPKFSYDAIGTQRAEDWLATMRRMGGELEIVKDELRDMASKDGDLSEKQQKAAGVLSELEMIYGNDHEIFGTEELTDFAKAQDQGMTLSHRIDKIGTGQGLYEYLTELANDSIAGTGSSTVHEWVHQPTMDQKEWMGTAEEIASKFLLSRGIPGIKYLDGSSRSRNKMIGYHNYVVFDDSLVNITKYEQPGLEGARGKLIKYGNYEFDIRMLEGADLSTFLHESGHLYLEILKNLQAEGKASDQMKADWETIHKYLGLEVGEEIKVEHHEKFADSIEQYFMEGTAPTEGLRLAFARFRVWLSALYQKYVNANIRLNDDIRQVFDRMFATQEEITASKEQAGMRPIFTTAVDAGMTDAEFKNYIKAIETANVKTVDSLQKKLIAQYTREKKQWWKDESEKIAATIQEQWKQDPGHQALGMLTDLPPEGKEALKLDGPALIAEFGKTKDNPKVAVLKSLDAYRVQGGVHHNIVAEVFGFKGGEQLIDAVIKAKMEEKGLADRVEAEMVARHGDMMKDGTLHEAAMEAVANEHQAAIIHTELRALIKQRNAVYPFVAQVKTTERKQTNAGVAMLRGVPPLAVFQRTAKDRIAATTLRQLNPSVYLVAARQAANQAMEAMGRKDYTIAAVAKQRQLLNMEMYREARNAVDATEQIVRYVNSFTRPTVRARIGQAGHDYMDQIDGLLDRFDFRPMSQASERKREALRDWLEVKARDGQEVDLPKEIIAEAQRRSYKTLTFDELTGIRDVLKHIEHLAGTKNKLLRKSKERRLDVLRGMVVDSVAENARPSNKASASTHAPQDSGKKLFRSWLASHRKLSSFARQLDGFKDGGIVWDLLVRPFNEAQDAQVRMQEELGPKLRALFAPYSKFLDGMKSQITVASQGLVEMGMFKRTLIPEINDSLSMMERMMVALNMGNPDNLTKLKAGHHWNDAQIRAIVEPLTKQDWDTIQGIWDVIDHYWPLIKAKQERVLGVAPEKVEASPVDTPHGTYPGGYFPLKYNDELSPKAYANRAAEIAKDMERGWFTRSTTRRGFTNERVEGVKEPVRLDFGVIWEHLNDVIHDLTHHEALIDANRIMGAPDVQRAFISALNPDAYREMQDAIKSIAAGDTPARGAFERNMNWLRSGVSVAAMGWNLTTAMMQGLGLFQSIVRVGPIWVAKGSIKWLADAASMENTVKWVYERSTTMRNRGHSQVREISELRNSLEGRAGTNTFKNTFYYFLAKGQMLVDMPTWLGAYEHGMEQFPGDEAKVIAVADQAVLDSQGGGEVKDLAGISRGNSLKKLFTTFYSYYSATYNLAAESVGRANKERDVISVGRAAVDLILLYSFPAVLGYMIKSAIKQLAGGDAPDEDEFWKHMWREQVAALAGSMVGPREMSSVIQGYYGYEGPAGARFYAEMAGMMKQIDQGEVDEALIRSINKTAGILFHYPASQVDKMARGYVAWSEGNDAPLAILFGPSGK